MEKLGKHFLSKECPLLWSRIVKSGKDCQGVEENNFTLRYSDDLDNRISEYVIVIGRDPLIEKAIRLLLELKIRGIRGQKDVPLDVLGYHCIIQYARSIPFVYVALS
jgi:hypothetical protein